jgi:hypothetical protein
MNELVLPFAVMALTVAVMLGLLVVFRKWLALREQIDRESRPAAPEARAQSTHRPHQSAPNRTKERLAA